MRSKADRSKIRNPPQASAPSRRTASTRRSRTKSRCRSSAMRPLRKPVASPLPFAPASRGRCPCACQVTDVARNDDCGVAQIIGDFFYSWICVLKKTRFLLLIHRADNLISQRTDSICLISLSVRQLCWLDQFLLTRPCPATTLHTEIIPVEAQPASRKRVLQWVSETPLVKRRQRMLKPCVSPSIFSYPPRPSVCEGGELFIARPPQARVSLGSTGVLE